MALRVRSSGWPGTASSLLAAGLLAAGCADAPTPAVFPETRSYGPALQEKLRTELMAIDAPPCPRHDPPEGCSAVKTTVPDHLHLRDQIRAARGEE